jgi:beta-glucosidase
LIITDHLPLADAWVAAWLPGSEGAGVADALFGRMPFSGRLSYDWPARMADVPLPKTGAAPLFPRGYGLP